jgi:hypothetical protein
MITNKSILYSEMPLLYGRLLDAPQAGQKPSTLPVASRPVAASKLVSLLYCVLTGVRLQILRDARILPEYGVLHMHVSGMHNCYL